MTLAIVLLAWTLGTPALLCGTLALSRRLRPAAKPAADLSVPCLVPVLRPRPCEARRRAAAARPRVLRAV